MTYVIIEIEVKYSSKIFRKCKLIYQPKIVKSAVHCNLKQIQIVFQKSVDLKYIHSSRKY